MYWFISEDVSRAMRHAVAGGWLPTAEQQLAHERKELEAASGPSPRGMSVAGDTAEIRIEGALTPKPDLFAMFFGGGNTTYRDIQAGLAAAASDPAIRKVVLSIDSPGGTVSGLFETLSALEALKATGKSIGVKASNAHSAAYAIAAVAGKIRAETPVSMFGSVGVAASFFVDDEVVDIANTDSPNKRPKLGTPEGQDVIRQELDALFEIFADAIARGRGVTVETVKSDFGRGASFVAGDAKKRNMIDAAPSLKIARAEHDSPGPVATVGDVVSAVIPQPAAFFSGENAGKKHPMTREELKAQHPELVDAIHAEGVSQERDRVVAHLTLGESSGDMKTAIEAITSGAEMTSTMTAKYLAAGMNRSAVQARQADSDAAGRVLDNGTKRGGSNGGAEPDQATNLLDLFASDLPAKKSA